MPTLPHDVLCVVASFCDKHELLDLMLVSRDLQLLCAKYVLQDTVKLKSDDGMESFIYFMRRNQRRRWRYLRSLEFPDIDFDPNLAGELGRVISRASHLETLYFEDAEYTLSSHPQLGLGLAAAPSVKHIELHRVSQHSCLMLEAMTWPLETVTLQESMDDRDWTASDRFKRMHPAALLKKACTTLKSFRYDMWSEYDLRLPEYPVYPAVHTLQFLDAYLPPTSQWPLTYPNLKKLTVFSISGESPMDDVTMERLDNVEEYAEVGCWHELEHFTGGVLDLYILGLPCRIHHVDIRVTSENLSFLEDALADARPSRVTMTLYDHQVYEGRIPERGLPAYLGIAGMAEVKYLRLEIKALSPKRTVILDPFLDHTFEAIAHLQVSDFVLYVQYPDSKDSIRRMICDTSDSEDGDTVRVRSPSPPPCPLQLWAESVNGETLARRAFETVPSLQSFELIIHPPYSVRRRPPADWEDLDPTIGWGDHRTRVVRDKVAVTTLPA